MKMAVVTTRPLLSLFAIAMLAVSPSRANVQGVIFEDRDGDGLRGTNEPVVPGVAISNGQVIALSDAQGHYDLATDSKTESVFVIKPSGYQTVLDAHLQPIFYSHLNPDERIAAAPLTRDFALAKVDENPRFRILAFTDVQPDSVEDLGFFERTFVEPLASSKDFAFGVNLGDVANDHPDLYDKIAAALGRIGVPWHEVIGNHDMVINGSEGGVAVLSFEKAFGPSTYAFRYADTLFIALNNIRPAGGPRYLGGLTLEQFSFIENLLKVTPKDDRVVILTHIPWFLPGVSGTQTFRLADRTRLFDLLKDRSRVFLMSGHTHAQRHVFHGPGDGWQGPQPLHEYNVAAACGSFWGGPRNAQGIPLSTMWDGTPNGYGIVTFAPDAVQTRYRAAQLTVDNQIGLHAPAAAHAGLSFVSYYANVFNGHEGWTVEGRVGSEAFHPLLRVIEWDPSYAALYLAQDTDPKPAAGKRLPDPTVCFHLWRGSLPPTLKAGEYEIEIRAKSPEGDVFATRQKVRVVGN
jgi:3',5'-cyclic AMP phosphodiesterase CpdA